jgi:D-alanyl-D-alanine endopeptidase (penicillin-binding protein 7)
MSASTFAADLIAYTLQTALLVGAGLLLPSLVRLRDPGARLACWQGLLLAVLVLPLVQPETGRVYFTEELAVTGRWFGQLAGSGAGEGQSWIPDRLLLFGLIAGTAGRLAWLGIGLGVLRSWRRRARPAVLSPEAEEIVSRMGARARLLICERVESPVTFGFRDPVVLLPADFPALPPAMQRGIVCHELLHVRRRDWLFALAEEVGGALLWFHPAVWMLLARIRLSREQVIDREVVRLTGSRRAYLEALRTVACRSWQAAVPGLPFFHRGHPRERVAHLAKEVLMSRSRIATLVTTFAGVVALTAVLAILVFPMAGTAWAGGKPRKVEGDVQRPVVVQQTPPVYPEDARKRGAEGMVVVNSVVDEQGRVKDLEVERSSGHPDLDQSALDAVATWRFQPATLDGEPVAVFYTLTINFKVDKKDESPQS